MSQQLDLDGVLKRGLDNLARLQGPRGSWPSDYGGPMFLLPMWVALAYVARRLPNEQRTARLVPAPVGTRSAERHAGAIPMCCVRPILTGRGAIAYTYAPWRTSSAG